MYQRIFIFCLIFLAIKLPMQVLANADLNIQSNSGSRADSSFFIISAIKTISGQNIQSEFFDINVKQQFGRYLVGLANIDIALATTKDRDNDTTEVSILSEAGYSLNYNLRTIKFLRFPHSQPVIGLKFKIFMGCPYIGLNMGSIETDSKLFSSYFMCGYLKSFYDKNSSENIDRECREFDHNFFIELAIQSAEIPFLKNLRIKGFLLMPSPLTKSPSPTIDDVKSRVVIEIPIGSTIIY